MALGCLCEGSSLPNIRKQVAAILPDTQVTEFEPSPWRGPKSGAWSRASRPRSWPRCRRISADGRRPSPSVKRAVDEMAAARQRIQHVMETLANGVTPIVVLAAAVWVGLLAWSNVRQRRTEIGLLKALGKGRSMIASLFLGKAVLLGLAGRRDRFAAGNLAGPLAGHSGLAAHGGPFPRLPRRSVLRAGRRPALVGVGQLPADARGAGARSGGRCGSSRSRLPEHVTKVPPGRRDLLSSLRPLTIFFSAGEPSGDLHGANLIRQLQAKHPQVQAVGYGGPLMEAAGCRLHADLTALAVMGFLPVVSMLPKFRGLVGRAEEYFRQQRPDAVLLIDFPGFNWWIARRAKAQGIAVFYYVPPQIWAWAQWRVKKMRRLVDHVLCSLPFEEKWLRKTRVATRPSSAIPSSTRFGGKNSIRPSCRSIGGVPARLVTILPGSRTQEVKMNLRRSCGRPQWFAASVPQARFAIASFKESQAELARQAVAASGLEIEVCVGRTPELIQLAEVCMAVSGSVSLELLYQTKPTVILYRVQPVGLLPPERAPQGEVRHAGQPA
jgi:lipid-A-disaccharide synthase